MIFTPNFNRIFTSVFSVTVNDFPCFVYIQKGIAEISFLGNRHTLKQGEGIIISSSFTLNVTDKNTSGLYMTFSRPDFLPCSVTIKPSPKSNLKRALVDMINSCGDHSSVIAEHLSLHCDHFFEQTKKLVTVGNPDYSTLAKKYIDENFTKDITLLNVARFCGISKTHLTGCFSDKYGISPWKYLTDKRIEKACHLLTHTSLNSKEIAATVGYTSPQRFNSMFKKLKSTTPLQYRAGIKRDSSVENSN